MLPNFSAHHRLTTRARDTLDNPRSFTDADLIARGTVPFPPRRFAERFRSVVAWRFRPSFWWRPRDDVDDPERGPSPSECDRASSPICDGHGPSRFTGRSFCRPYVIHWSVAPLHGDSGGAPCNPIDDELRTAWRVGGRPPPKPRLDRSAAPLQAALRRVAGHCCAACRTAGMMLVRPCCVAASMRRGSSRVV